MPQTAPLVLTDRATPVADHTFNPRGADAGVTTFAESVTGVPLADRRITVSAPRIANGRAKVTVKIALPVVQNVDVGGVSKPTIVRTNYADLSFNYDVSSSTRERDDVVSFVNGLTAWDDNTEMLGVLVDLQGLW